MRAHGSSIARSREISTWKATFRTRHRQPLASATAFDTVASTSAPSGQQPHQQQPSTCNRRHALLASLLLAATAGPARDAFAAAPGPVAPPSDPLMRMARMEPDPENALSIWDEVVERDGGTAVSLYERGNCNLKLRRFPEALQDLSRAAPLLREARGSGGGVATLPDGGTVPQEVVWEALALDGMGLAQGQMGNWTAALDCHLRALGTAGAAGASDASIPEETAYSGLRGGAATLGRRLELHAAMARFGGGDAAGAAAALRRVDKGPDPDGYPQFWDARAALAVALAASGAAAEAEEEWAALCRPAPAPPPATPTSPVLARVNRVAQTLMDAQGLLADRNCEDFETGVYLPCDDAGIPGLGGSNSPCALYTPEEAAARLWPAAMVRQLQSFRGQSQAEISQNKARAALSKRSGQ